MHDCHLYIFIKRISFVVYDELDKSLNSIMIDEICCHFRYCYISVMSNTPVDRTRIEIIVLIL